MKFSETTAGIFKALADFRKELLQPKKDAKNPQFNSKYVPLEVVTDAIDKVAPKYGLAYFQNITTDNDFVGIQTVITHESGEYIEFDMLYMDSRPIIKGGNKGVTTAQSQGSAITYGRRYSLSSAFGIASEVDDDGNGATGTVQQTYQPQANQGRTITEPTKSEAIAKAKELKKSIAELKDTTQKQVEAWLFDYLKVKSSSEITDWNTAVAYLIKLESKAKEVAGG